MSEVLRTEIKTLKSVEKITKKLEVQDYAFEINNSNIIDVSVTYYMDKIKESIYVDGEKKKIIEKDLISILLSGKTLEGKETWISFDIISNIDKLNSYTDIPVDITKDIDEGETFIGYPDKSVSWLDFYMPTNTKSDIFHNLSSAWISKVADNVFIIKLCVPNTVFTYFKIDFNDIIQK